MPATSTTAATLADLARTPGKAELIGGRIVPLMPTGHLPNRIAARIFRGLDNHAEAIGRGFAYTDNVGFAVPELSSGRQSFSPDASLYIGPLPGDEMDFVEGVPALAVEVRCKADYGGSAEAALSAKRADYFEAGTLVVWDVDPRAGVIRAYRAASPEVCQLFGPGEMAEAEPAIPRWRLAVDRLFA